jgi:hypothetical protein
MPDQPDYSGYLVEIRFLEQSEGGAKRWTSQPHRRRSSASSR